MHGRLEQLVPALRVPPLVLLLRLGVRGQVRVEDALVEARARHAGRRRAAGVGRQRRRA